MQVLPSDVALRSAPEPRNTAGEASGSLPGSVSGTARSASEGGETCFASVLAGSTRSKDSGDASGAQPPADDTGLENESARDGVHRPESSKTLTSPGAPEQQSASISPSTSLGSLSAEDLPGDKENDSVGTSPGESGEQVSLQSGSGGNDSGVGLVHGEQNSTDLNGGDGGIAGAGEAAAELAEDLVASGTDGEISALGSGETAADMTGGNDPAVPHDSLTGPAAGVVDQGNDVSQSAQPRGLMGTEAGTADGQIVGHDQTTTQISGSETAASLASTPGPAETADSGAGTPLDTVASNSTASGSKGESDVESAARASTVSSERPTVGNGSEGRPDVETFAKGQPGETGGQSPSGSTENRGPGGDKPQGAPSGTNANPGRDGTASATTVQASLAGKGSEAISGSRVATGGGGQASDNAQGSGSRSEQLFSPSGREESAGGTGESTQQGSTRESAHRDAMGALGAQGTPTNSSGVSGSPSASLASGPSEGGGAGIGRSTDGSDPGTEPLVQSGAPVRGSESSFQPNGETVRLAGSSIARLEQALNADFERGFVGRLRDNGEMRLTVQGNDLGEMELRVAVRENGVHASIATQHDEARQILNSHRSDLETALQRYNLRLDSFTVDVGNRDGRSALRNDSQEGGLSETGKSGSAGLGSGQSIPTEEVQSHDKSEGGLSVRV